VRISVLASGSSGNAAILEADGTCVLIDCGLSYRQLVTRMRALGLDPARIEAVLLTHEHDDHVKGLELFLRRHKVPVLATAGTVTGMAWRPPAAAPVLPGRGLKLGGVSVVAVPTSHDAREPVGFLIEGDGCRVGFVTDTGVVTELLSARFAGCDALLFECNHDRDLLRAGPYPWPLKQRIASRTGHLSNEQACAALERLAHSGLETVVAMHLSRTNNRPELVRRELAEVLAGSGVRLALASQDVALEVEVGGARAPVQPRS
jgi:phosphoribosyl 1,2-cyclic phosphodiesterase